MITLKDFSPNNIPTQKQVDFLAQFLIENFENEIGKNGNENGEGAIEMAVRLLVELKERIINKNYAPTQIKRTKKSVSYKTSGTKKENTENKRKT